MLSIKNTLKKSDSHTILGLLLFLLASSDWHSILSPLSPSAIQASLCHFIAFEGSTSRKILERRVQYSQSGRCRLVGTPIIARNADHVPWYRRLEIAGLMMYKYVSISMPRIFKRVCEAITTAMMSRVSVAVIGAGVLSLELTKSRCDTDYYISRADRHYHAQTAATGRVQCYSV